MGEHITGVRWAVRVEANAAAAPLDRAARTAALIAATTPVKDSAESACKLLTVGQCLARRREMQSG
jgi:hypothetical protein